MGDGEPNTLVVKGVLFDVVLLPCEREGERVSSPSLTLTQFYTIDPFFFFFAKIERYLRFDVSVSTSVIFQRGYFRWYFNNFFSRKSEYDVMT